MRRERLKKDRKEKNKEEKESSNKIKEKLRTNQLSAVCIIDRHSRTYVRTNCTCNF